LKTKIIIPARYGSSRYRGKPLVKILGREMVLRVADICVKVCGLENLYIATDNKKISDTVKRNNYKAVMTSKRCLTGTDRVAEASKKINANIFINVQGDEPTISPSDIKKVIKAKLDNPNHVICGYDKIHKYENPSNKNIPKVVMNLKSELIYISRSIIPGTKKKTKNNFYKQVCIYAFNKKQLDNFSKQKIKSPIEDIEDIEILRFFDLGIKIKMVKLNSNSVAVDEKSDVKKAEKILKKYQSKKNKIF
tara:strand:- start:436 stop:1185 length:750 start_codon:yes stop_codon:yes gene_type:complete